MFGKRILMAKAGAEGSRKRTVKEREKYIMSLVNQMTAVAEKYHSILDISYTDTEFTVQTALKLPEQP